MGEKHKEALATLRYGVLDNKGFLLLTGDVGTGKTTLINTLIKSLGDDVICTTVPDPSLDRLEFFNYIAAGFGIDREITSKGMFLVQFRYFLQQADRNNKTVVLIIDECQLVTQELLEEIRLLSNIEKADKKLLNIFFVGQNEFNEILSRSQNRAVRQRLTLNYNIEPLTFEETGKYIRYRLDVSGGDQGIFNAEAVRQIYLYSRGFPRRINILCDHALLTGYVNDKKIIDGAIVHECARELNIPVNKGKTAVEGDMEDKDSAGQIASDKVFRKAASPENLGQKGSGRVLKNGRGHQNGPAKKKRFWPALLGVLIIVLLSGYLLFPDKAHRSFKNADIYIDRIRAVLSELLPRDNPEEREPPGPNSSGSDDLQEKSDQSAHDQKTDDLVTKKIEMPQQPFLKITLEDTDKKGSSENKISFTPGETSGIPDLARLPSPLKRPGVEQVSLPPDIPPLPESNVIVRFKYNTNDFTEKGLKALDRFASTIVHYPEADVILKGYTDSHGNQAYNRKLSEFRANIVRSFLLGRGVAPDKVTVIGMGIKNPIESNDTAWGRTMNRRVEIEVVPKG